MKTKFLKLGVVLLLLGVVFAGCERNEPEVISNNTATGTIIGSYVSGWFVSLVQVDSSYPIGKTLDWTSPGSGDSCTKLYRYGVFMNVIGIQPLEMQLSKVAEGLIRISFSYRKFCYESDIHLFFLGHGNHACVPPDVPLYVVTDFQILN